VLALYFFGGSALEGFSFTLLVGVVVGTWSSVFVAAPVAALAGRSPQYSATAASG
jgi:preprotein translocase subunit SecF